jgi:hypothetical protein
MRFSLEMDLGENQLPTYYVIKKQIGLSLDVYREAVALGKHALEDDRGTIHNSDGKRIGEWRVRPGSAVPIEDEPKCLSSSKTVFTRYFVHCKTEWTDDADSICNDRCPKCNREIEPYAVSDDAGNLTLQVIAASFQPEGGLPDGVADVTDLLGWPPTIP